MTFKFEQLEVWQLALDYVDWMYRLAEELPPKEEYNLASQLRRAATSIALNITEGSTGQSDAEQNRFLGMALRSLMEQSLTSASLPVVILYQQICYRKVTKKLNCWPENSTLSENLSVTTGFGKRHPLTRLKMGYKPSTVYHPSSTVHPPPSTVL